MFAWLLEPSAYLALGTLTILEIVLGIDNIIFLSLIISKLPHTQQARARSLGLLAAMMMRLILLMSIALIMSLKEPLFTIFNHSISARDLILLGGGIFLIVKATKEIHESIEHSYELNEEYMLQSKKLTFISAILQIMILDVVFSLDSVITAIGLSNQISMMMLAIVIAIFIMMLAVKAIGDFVENNPSVKMLALSFLILVGFTLILDSVHIEVPKGYIYFAMFFSMSVEVLNLWSSANKRKVKQQEIENFDLNLRNK